MEYKVIAIGSQGANAPKHWSGKFGDMIDYKVKFEGEADSVTISQKASSPAPKAGDVLAGKIDREAQYGPKFTKDFTPGARAGGSKPFSPTGRDDNRIVAQWSIGQAINVLSAGVVESIDTELIEPLAVELFQMASRVKDTDTTPDDDDDFGDTTVVPVEDIPEGF